MTCNYVYVSLLCKRASLSTPPCPLLEQFPIPSVMIPLLVARRVSKFIWGIYTWSIHKRASIAICIDLFLRVSRACWRLSLFSHVKLASPSILRDSWIAWTTCACVDVRLYTVNAVMKKAGLLEWSRSHKKNVCSAIMVNATTHKWNYFRNWVNLDTCGKTQYLGSERATLNLVGD